MEDAYEDMLSAIQAGPSSAVDTTDEDDAYKSWDEDVMDDVIRGIQGVYGKVDRRSVSRFDSEDQEKILAANGKRKEKIQQLYDLPLEITILDGEEKGSAQRLEQGKYRARPVNMTGNRKTRGRNERSEVADARRHEQEKAMGLEMSIEDMDVPSTDLQLSYQEDGSIIQLDISHDSLQGLQCPSGDSPLNESLRNETARSRRRQHIMEETHRTVRNVPILVKQNSM